MRKLHWPVRSALSQYGKLYSHGILIRMLVYKGTGITLIQWKKTSAEYVGDSQSIRGVKKL